MSGTNLVDPGSGSRRQVYRYEVGPASEPLVRKRSEF